MLKNGDIVQHRANNSVFGIVEYNGQSVYIRYFYKNDEPLTHEIIHHATIITATHYWCKIGD